MCALPLISVPEKPPDADQVIAAFRLGWALAELRGRRRPGRKRELPVPLETRPRQAHDLPLFNERKWTEQTTEAEAVLKAMAEELKGVDETSGNGPKADAIVEFGESVDSNPSLETWKTFTEKVYQWDCKIQDGLVRWPSQAAAYQLGRGLAEIYWALDPDGEAGGWTSWEFLLGEARCTTLKSLIARLSSYVDPLRRVAVIKSLDAWTEVASDPSWRTTDEPDLAQLYKQATLWRDLVRGERDPKDSAKRPVSGTLGILIPVARAFWIQAAVALVSVLMLVGGGYALATGGSHAGFLFTAVGALGITSAGLYAQAKASALRLIERIRLAVEERLVAWGAQVIPPRPEPETVKGKLARNKAALGTQLGATTDIRTS